VIKQLFINDLTKEEILRLIIEQGLNRLITPHAIKLVRWNSMTCEAKDMMDEACEKMKTYHGPQNYQNYKRESDKFNRAMKLYAKADEFIASH